MKRTLTVLSALAGLLTFLLPLGALPANASVSSGVIGGANGITDDWGDEGTLSTSSHANSGATELWQWVLYADGATESNGSAFDQSDIDGDFGPNTDAATRDWQHDHGLGVDGEVGPLTFGAADAHLSVHFQSGDEIQITYSGSAHAIRLYRLAGVYWSPTPGTPTTLVKATYGSGRTTETVPTCFVNATCF
ncbi:MAG TPA: peptidoglycan-binding domain-containing protein [Mycobacteriales bacterium]